MRILHLIHSEGLYGAELVLLYLAREQQQRGHVPTIGSIRDPGTPQTAFEARALAWGLAVVPIRIAPRPTPGVIRTLLRTIRDLRPDVLHSHGYKPDILLGFLPRGTRGPMVTTLHGWSTASRFSALWLYERLDRLAIRRIDMTVVVTQRMLELPAVRQIAARRRRVIENGIPPLATRLADMTARDVAPLSRELVDFTSRRPTLVAIGRLAPAKGFLLLVEAFGRAQAQCMSQYQLLIVGAGPQREVLLERIAVLQLTAVVRLAGYVDGADRLLNGAAGFVMSSLTEGMPLVLLEALQWQVPVLATSVGAIPELLGQGQFGTLVRPNDVGALADGLRGIFTSSAVPQGTGRVRNGAGVRFSSARMAEEYLSAYTAVVPHGALAMESRTHAR